MKTIIIEKEKIYFLIYHLIIYFNYHCLSLLTYELLILLTSCVPSMLCCGYEQYAVLQHTKRMYFLLLSIQVYERKIRSLLIIRNNIKGKRSFKHVWSWTASFNLQLPPLRKMF